MSSLLANCFRRLTEAPTKHELRGFKVTDVSRTRKFGVACRSLQELKRKASTKLNLCTREKASGSEHFPRKVFIESCRECDIEFYGWEDDLRGARDWSAVPLYRTTGKQAGPRPPLVCTPRVVSVTALGFYGVKAQI